MGLFGLRHQEAAPNKMKERDHREELERLVHAVMQQVFRLNEWKFVQTEGVKGYLCKVQICPDGSLLAARGFRKGSMPDVSEYRSMPKDVSGLRARYQDGKLTSVTIYCENGKDCDIDFSKPVRHFHAQLIRAEAEIYLERRSR